jgi:hypothetical protein
MHRRTFDPRRNKGNECEKLIPFFSSSESRRPLTRKINFPSLFIGRAPPPRHTTDYQQIAKAPKQWNLYKAPLDNEIAPPTNRRSDIEKLQSTHTQTHTRAQSSGWLWN